MKITIPDSMKDQLSSWNNGRGIDLESWVGCEGSFSLAVGYAAVFWPTFTEFEGYILRDRFSEQALRGFEEQQRGNRRAIETVMNHWHVADIQHVGCKDLTKDKVFLLGHVLKEIHTVKLAYDYPDRPCTVSLHIPDDVEDLEGYEISFWQKKHEADGV